MKPIQYVIDLGIDANLGIESGPTYPLQQGLVAVSENSTSGEGTPQWYTKFRQKDQFSFRLWDITGESSGGIQIVSFTAYFLSPTDPSRLSKPLAVDSPNPIIFSCEMIYPVASTVKSSVFENPNDGWLVGADTSPLGKTYALEKQGRYLLRIEVVVVVPPLGRRTYVLDPEMIVGSSDNPGETLPAS